MTHKASRSRLAASAAGSAGTTTSPGTSACAVATGMAARSPSVFAASSTAVSRRRLPVRPIMTSGVSVGHIAPPAVRRSRSVGQFGR